jgi:hypothetical protein
MTPEERAREIVERLSNRLRSGFAEILRLRSELNRAQQAIREAEQAAYERAAKVAEQYNGYGPDGRCLTGYGATPFTAASDIAESIRALGKQEA